MTRAPAEGVLASFLFGYQGLAGGPGSKGGRSARLGFRCWLTAVP